MKSQTNPSVIEQQAKNLVDKLIGESKEDRADLFANDIIAIKILAQIKQDDPAVLNHAYLLATKATNIDARVRACALLKFSGAENADADKQISGELLDKISGLIEIYKSIKSVESPHDRNNNNESIKAQAIALIDNVSKKSNDNDALKIIERQSEEILKHAYLVAAGDGDIRTCILLKLSNAANVDAEVILRSTGELQVIDAIVRLKKVHKSSVQVKNYIESIHDLIPTLNSSTAGLLITKLLDELKDVNRTLKDDYETLIQLKSQPKELLRQAYLLMTTTNGFQPVDPRAYAILQLVLSPNTDLLPNALLEAQSDIMTRNKIKDIKVSLEAIDRLNEIHSLFKPQIESYVEAIKQTTSSPRSLANFEQETKRMETTLRKATYKARLALAATHPRNDICLDLQVIDPLNRIYLSNGYQYNVKLLHRAIHVTFQGQFNNPYDNKPLNLDDIELFNSFVSARMAEGEPFTEEKEEKEVTTTLDRHAIQATLAQNQDNEDDHQIVPDIKEDDVSDIHHPYYKLCIEGRDFSWQSDHKKAIEKFTDAIRLRPDQSRAYFERAASYFDTKNFDAAMEDLNEAIRLDPLDGAYYSNRAFLYKEIGNHDDKELQDLNSAVEVAPRERDYLFARAEFYMRTKNFNAALRDYNKGHSLFPNRYLCYMNRARCYKEMCYHNAAIRDYSCALKTLPEVSFLDQVTLHKYGKIYCARAEAYREIGKYDLAILEFNEALFLLSQCNCAEEDIKSSYIGRGLTHYCKGDYASALHDFEEAIKLDPKSHLAFYYLGFIYLERNERDKAEMALSSARSLCPPESATRFHIDYILQVVLKKTSNPDDLAAIKQGLIAQKEKSPTDYCLLASIECLSNNVGSANMYVFEMNNNSTPIERRKIPNFLQQNLDEVRKRNPATHLQSKEIAEAEWIVSRSWIQLEGLKEHPPRVLSHAYLLAAGNGNSEGVVVYECALLQLALCPETNQTADRLIKDHPDSAKITAQIQDIKRPFLAIETMLALLKALANIIPSFISTLSRPAHATFDDQELTKLERTFQSAVKQTQSVFVVQQTSRVSETSKHGLFGAPAVSPQKAEQIESLGIASNEHMRAREEKLYHADRMSGYMSENREQILKLFAKANSQKWEYDFEYFTRRPSGYEYLVVDYLSEANILNQETMLDFINYKRSASNYMSNLELNLVPGLSKLIEAGKLTIDTFTLLLHNAKYPHLKDAYHKAVDIIEGRIGQNNLSNGLKAPTRS